MKDNVGKVLLTLVVVAVIISVGLIFNAIFSKLANMDHFIVWLIFIAEGLKKLLMSNWNSAFSFIGTIMLLIWFIYFAIRVFGSKDVTVPLPEGDEAELTWDEKKERIFQKYGGVFWKIGLCLWILSFSMDFTAAIIPTAKQSAVIYVVPKIMNNVDMQEIPPNLAKLVNEGLKDMIESVKGDVGEVAKDAAGVAKEVTKDVIQDVAEKAKDKIKGSDNK